jgi:hypothetical protein
MAPLAAARLVELYALAGCLFAAAFVTTLLPRFDKAARGTSWALRALAFPGAALLWPLLLQRCLARQRNNP